MDWCRLWHDMPTDPKWKVVARKSGRTIPEVIAVYTHMLVTASKAEERGTLAAWDDEDVAASLDMGTEHVTAIREAMQGKVLNGDSLSGWNKRQPKDPYATDRKRRQREREAGQDVTKPDTKGDVTKCHGASRDVTPEERRGDKRREDNKKNGADAPTDDGSLSAEEMYWALKPKAQEYKITGSLMGKALKQLGDADAAYDALTAALKAKEPRRYFSAVAQGKHQGGEVLSFPSDPEEPQWVREARAQGDEVELIQRSPRRWRHTGDIHDDEGKVVGW